MIYEVRTYTFTVGAAGRAVEDFGRIIERRVRLSPLVGFFVPAAGLLNRILHIWAYESSAHRESVRAEAERQPWWPPLDAESILHQDTRLMAPAPFCPQPRTGAMGAVYEIRSDVFRTGRMAALAAEWERTLPERERLSPLAAAFSNEAGPFASGVLNELLHLWPYRDAGHWAEVREAAAALPNWRAHPADHLLRQTAELWRPVDYSPMR